MGKRVGPRALGAFVEGLERGLRVVEAAAAAGADTSTFYRLRKPWPEFAEAWDEAVDKSSRPMLIAAGNKRRLQKRRSRRVRFTAARKERFLGHFAATCDAKASAETAGVCKDTVYKHLARDPAFADGWQAALEAGYAALEAELVAQQRAAREALRPGSGQAYRIVPDAGALAEPPDFEKAMRLLQLWRRKDGRIGKRDSPVGDPRMRWSFEEAMAELEKKLEAFGVRVEGEEGDEPSGGHQAEEGGER